MVGWSLKRKLMVLCVFQAALPLIVGGISFFGLLRIAGSYEQVTGRVLPNIENSNSMYVDFKDIRINLRSLGLPNLSKEQASYHVEEVRKHILTYEKATTRYQEVTFIDGEKELFDKVQLTWEDFKTLGDRVLKLYGSSNPADKEALSKIILEDCPQLASRYEAAIQNLVQFHKDNGKKWVSDARAATSWTDLTAILTNIVGLFLGVGAGVWVAFSVSKSINSISEHLGSEAHEVGTAAEKISVSSKDLSSASSSQAASLEETVATMEQITSMVKISAGNAKSAAGLADETRRNAIRGENEIKVLIQSMKAISDDSKKIADITNVIDDIAFQTNLLALNAAVEAARAGEQGKGFAVVADAVRSLAQRSADSAKNIAGLIQGSGELIKKGSQQAEAGGIVLGEIVNSIKKVADLSQEIASGSEEQSAGIQQIGKALNDLDQVTQQNASASEEASAFAQHLEHQSSQMRHYVGELNHIIKGTKAA